MNTEIITLDAVVVGSGAAGYATANRIRRDCKKSVALITEGVLCGTSRNTGSDKQTYYKLGLGGDAPDSVRRMAEDLFSYGAVDGDTALCEAALSARAFLHLCELGVPFPVNRYGEYVGYKTDHDPFARATSAGPLTSKFMTEALQKEASELDLMVYDGYYAVEVLTDREEACGLLALDKKSGEFVVLRAPHIVLATGGPAGIYADSVYPQSQSGASSLALRAGASLQNMTEWQYGLASIHPRWNVSGTYMQVLPRFISVDSNGDEREFLSDYFANPYEALSNVFLKGYQWPFDSKKVLDGSSVIDLLVYRECVLRRRRVYLDYTKNPFGMEQIDFSRLSPEAYGYLSRANACFGTPIERLAFLNQPAIELYQSKGVDITRTPLEIALCAQHNNGGIAVDLWWETHVKGLYAVGECAGTHGVARPGGSALNAGQVGALRASRSISASSRVPLSDADFSTVASNAVIKYEQLRDRILQNEDNATVLINAARRKMSDCAGAIRRTEDMRAYIEEIGGLQKDLFAHVGVSSRELLYRAFQLRDILQTQIAVLASMIDFSEIAGATRGSALSYDTAGELREGLEECFRFRPKDALLRDQVQSVRLTKNATPDIAWRDVRPIPDADDVFETVWRRFREDENIY